MTIVEKNFETIDIFNGINKTNYLIKCPDESTITFDVYFEKANQESIRIVFPQKLFCQENENKYEKSLYDFLEKKRFQKINF